MSINLTPGQLKVGQQAVQPGLVRSVDEFIGSAIEALSRRERGFDRERARRAGARIRELRKGGTLDLRGVSVREPAHIGHKRCCKQ